MVEIIEKTELVYDPEDEYVPVPEPEPEAPKWLDGSYRIGIHTTIAGDIARSLDIAHRLGCNALQIFTTSPRMWPRPGRTRIADADAARFMARRAELGLGPVAVHANYLINLAATEPVARVRTIQVFRDEVVRAMSIGADFLIVHPGSARDGNMKRGAELVADGLRQSARGLKLGGLRILVENTAGMGNCIGSRFEELAAIIAGAPEVDLGVCLDTAHLFAAGFPIHTAAGLEQTLAHVDRTIGLDRVMVLHINDSKTAHGSRVDRHEHVGRGKIGSEAMERILRHPLLSPQRVAGRAFLLETPIDAPGDDRRNIAAVWKLVGVAVEQVPDAEDGFSMLAKARAEKPSPQHKSKAKAESRRRKVESRPSRKTKPRRAHASRSASKGKKKAARRR
jgi:deoxyribonuclease IV